MTRYSDEELYEAWEAADDVLSEAMDATAEDAGIPAAMAAMRAVLEGHENEQHTSPDGACPTHGDPLVCLACEAEEDAQPTWQEFRRRDMRERLKVRFGERDDQQMGEGLSDAVIDAIVTCLTLEAPPRDA